MSILEDLYYGRISVWGRKATPSAERSEVSRKIEDERQYFLGKMSPDDCERFQALEDLYTQSGDFEEIDAFYHGFRMGALLMIEVFADDKDKGQPEEAGEVNDFINKIMKSSK